MAKLAIVATIKIAPGGRDEYLKHLRAHAERCRATSRSNTDPRGRTRST